MTLRLVGAGLPRTGTSSLRDALELLLGGPCHHMRDVFRRPERAPTWLAAMRGDPPDWHAFLAGYVAALDTPVASCWREVSAAFPDAVVLLSHRDTAETWLRSMEPTVLDRIRHARDHGEPGDPVRDVLVSVLDGVVDDLDDPASLLAGYERRLAEVRAEVDPRRLVEWQPGDGWEPLCRALDLPVPDVAFPHENSRADFLRRTAEHRAEGSV